MTATEIIQADDEKAVSVYRFARANTFIPPAGFFVAGFVVARRVVVSAQGMANQHRVGAILVELAVGFVHQFVARQITPTGKFQWLVKDCVLRRDNSYGMRTVGSAHDTCVQSPITSAGCKPVPRAMCPRAI